MFSAERVNTHTFSRSDHHRIRSACPLTIIIILQFTIYYRFVANMVLVEWLRQISVMSELAGSSSVCYSAFREKTIFSLPTHKDSIFKTACLTEM